MAEQAVSANTTEAEDAFRRLQEAANKRLETHQKMYQTFAKLSALTVEVLKKCQTYAVEAWEDGFSFEIGDFEFVCQLADFDDGSKWPLTLWLKHEDVGFWKRVDDESMTLIIDTPEQVLYGSKTYPLPEFLAEGLFSVAQKAIETYVVTEEDEEHGATDEDLFED